MIPNDHLPARILLIVLPNFNLAATVGFIDPFRAANYLDGRIHFQWSVASISGGLTIASNGLSLDTKALASIQNAPYDTVILSSSWTPEDYENQTLKAALRRWARTGTTLGALDTGAFILARAGLLAGRSATVHYEHIDAFQELYPDVKLSDHLFVFDKDRISCCGGEASTDFALHIVRQAKGDQVANEAARYLLHEHLRPTSSRQNPAPVEPLGSTVPDCIKQAIQIMEDNLEIAIPIPLICEKIDISQRQLDRLFQEFVKKTPAGYYRDIRLDRARGLVTQTSLPLSEVAIASGFASPTHFSRAYRERFGLPPQPIGSRVGYRSSFAPGPCTIPIPEQSNTACIAAKMDISEAIDA